MCDVDLLQCVVVRAVRHEGTSDRHRLRA
jgi:hypothetical protein